MGGESTTPQGGIASAEANGKPLEKVPDGLRRRAAEALALEAANVLEGRDGFGAPSSKRFHNKWDEGYVFRLAGRGVRGSLPFSPDR